MSGRKTFARRTSGLVREASLLDTFAYNSSASSFVAILWFYTWVVTFAPGGNILSAIPLSL
ncbi:APC family permease, partial [Candidatus Bathyarchaeota archaeon]